MATDTTERSPQARIVSAIPLFQSMEEFEVKLLADLLEEVTYAAGETIFEQDEPGDAMYILYSGAVRIWTRDEDGNEVVLARLEPGAFFGELAVLDGSPRSASATVTQAASLYRLSKKDFQAFMLAHPAVALDMIQEVGNRLRQTNKIVTQRAARDINREMEAHMTSGQRAADRLVSFFGSWTFILLCLISALAWIGLNIFLLARFNSGAETVPFDPYPYFLLSLLLSLVVALQAPVILMALKRAREKDRLAAETGFKVSLKSEMLLENLTRSVELLCSEQKELLERTRNFGATRGDGETTTGDGAQGRATNGNSSAQT